LQVRKLVVLLAVTAVAAVAVSSASAARGMKIGFYDEAVTLGYPDDFGFRTLDDLGAQVLRMNLYWNEVARARPDNPTDPDDPAYNWSKWDEALERADQYGIDVILSIIGTPRWANGGKAVQYAPNDWDDLQAFSQAAADRYRQVTKWMAGNEPNAPNFLKPQSVRRGGKWVFVSPEIYANMCKAVVNGVNAARSSNTIACGALNPRGKLEANGRRDSVAPILFLQRMAAAGAPAEVIAVHPYSSTPRWGPTKKIKSNSQIVLGTINKFITAVNKAYSKRTRIWVTEYGYQTNPPDKLFGVTWKTQAKWLTQAFNIMRKNPRIDIALNFQILDDSRLGGWQSGVMTNAAKPKPSYAAFKRL
jgi:hypothetical protein